MKSKPRTPFLRATVTGLTPGRVRPVALALSCVLLTACATVGPDYREPPPVDVGSGWSLPLASESQSADLSQWWSALDDPILDRLMATALAQNLDLRQAAARIDEARALRERVAGEALPTAAAGASVNRRRQSENGPLPVGSIPGLDATQTIYDAGFDAAWEADLFGAKRRALEGASARLQATEAEAQGIRMRIVAEVARTWFTAVGARYELHAQQATLDTLQQTLELVRLRHALGDASAADVEAAYAQWTAVNALIPDIQARQRAAILSLGVLLGATPQRLGRPQNRCWQGALLPDALIATPQSFGQRGVPGIEHGRHGVRRSSSEVRAHALNRGPLALGEHGVGRAPDLIDLNASGDSRTFHLHRPASHCKLPTIRDTYRDLSTRFVSNHT